MRNKPSWGFWLVCAAAYSALDMVLAWLLHTHLSWSTILAAIEGAALGATLTWLFALRRWYKANL